MRPSQTSSARGCSLTCGIISRGCNCLRRWRWVKSKIILKMLVLTNCPSGDSDIILEQQAGAPWSLRVGLRPRIFAVEGKILPAHIFTHPWSHWCGILSAQNRGSEKPITPVPMSDIQHSRNYVSPASELEEGAFLFRDCCGNGRHYRKHVDGSFTLCFVDWLRCMSWNSNWIVAGESVPAGSSPWFHLLPCFLALAGCEQWHWWLIVLYISPTENKFQPTCEDKKFLSGEWDTLWIRERLIGKSFFVLSKTSRCILD